MSESHDASHPASPAGGPDPRPRWRRLLARVAAAGFLLLLGWFVVRRFAIDPGYVDLRNDSRWRDVLPEGSPSPTLTAGLDYRFVGQVTGSSADGGGWEVRVRGQSFAIEADDDLPDLEMDAVVDMVAEFVRTDRWNMPWDATVTSHTFRRARVLSAPANPGRPQEDFWADAATFSPDDRSLATGEARGRLRVREVATGRLLGDYHVQGKGKIADLSFAPDGTRLAVVRGETTSVLDLASGAVRGRFPGVGARFTRDGTCVVVREDGGRVSLWDAQGTGRRWTIRAQPVSTEALALSPDGRLVATGGVDAERTVTLSEEWGRVETQEPVGMHSIAVYEVATAALHRRLPGTDAAVATLAFLGEHTLVCVTRGNRSSLTEWDLSTGTSTDLGRWDAVVSGGKYLARTPSGSARPEVEIADRRGRVLRSLPVRLVTLAFTSDGTRVTGGGRHGPRLSVWDVESGACVGAVAELPVATPVGGR